MVGASEWPLIEFRVDDFTEPWRTGETPTVLFHPGLGGNLRLFRLWVPYLADRFRVIRITARGQGGTERPEGFERSLENFAADAIAVLDHLRVSTAHWVGASGGGIIGQFAALAYPDRIRSLSLLATTARFRGPSGSYDDWLAPLERGDQRAFIMQDAERRFGKDNPARTEWIVDELCRTGPSESAAMHRWVVTVDLTDRLSSIQCPALVVTGEQDTLTDTGDADLLAERIPNSRKVILAERPHNIAYTHPGEVAPLVREFLDEVETENDRLGSSR